MNQGEVDHFILAYLREKGYKEAEQALERSLQRVNEREPGSMSLSDRLSVHKGVVEHLVNSFATADQPQAYVEAIDRLISWLDSSLDMYRSELSQVLYPIFMHTYLTLVAKDASQQATAMLSRLQPRLMQIDGRVARSRAAELQELSGVVLKQHITSNSFVRRARSRKHHIRISQYAHDLLIHFIHTSPGMLCLAAILNQYVNLEISASDLQQQQQDDDLQGGEGPDDAADDPTSLTTEGATINSQPVQLGLLQGNPEDKYAELQAQKGVEDPGGGPAVPDGGGGGTPADKGGGDGEGTAAKKVKKDPKAEGQPATEVKYMHEGDRVKPEPWTPVLTDAVLKAQLKDIECRADVSRSNLPSCCIFTFANTKQTLNCAAFASSAHMIAAGFADSSVRLYDLEKLATGSSSAARVARAGSVAVEASPTKPSPPQPSASNAMDIDDDDQTQTGVTYLYGHTGPVHAVDFSHDHRLLFSASTDGTVRLWGAGFGACLTAYRGHLLPVWDVACGPQGYHFVSAGADRTARVWATDSVRMIRVLAGHQSDVDCVAWHPNCHYAATASSDRSVRLWDVATGKCVRFMSGLHSAPTSMAINPDGRHIAVGSGRGQIHVWDLGTGRKVAGWKAHQGPVWSLTYSKGMGSLLASGGADETVRVWSAQDVAAAAAASSSLAPTSNPKINHSKYDQVVASHTKSSSVTCLQFSNRNLLLAAGAFNFRNRKQ